MLLIARWPERPPTLVVTIDHGLRPEAKKEAEQAAQNALKHGLPWRIMRAPEHKRGNLQDWARRERYRCLKRAAEEAGYDTIVTAHHVEDQAETFLLRLARGSGVYGLGAIPVEGRFEGMRVVRPLLGVARDRLSELAAAAGIPTVNDPSNDDPRFDRVRMRAFLPALAEQGLTPARLAETAERLGRAAAALDHYVRVLIDAHFLADRFGVVRGDATALASVPEEVGLRALALILKAVGGADHTPRLDRLEPIFSAILKAKGRDGFRRTLHGVVLSLGEGRLAARREWGRQGPATVAAPAGSTLDWDRRFRIQVPSGAELSVGPLGRSQLKLRSEAADQVTLRTLPGLFAGETLLAVPADIVALDAISLGQLAAECVVPARLGIAPAAAVRQA